eukprot:CAMPEP_0173430624 /NCGR_PEP_ID=MMETSP1357-20121228/9002_1 /TAXON_ID=77926 /ORGANISM="Hemiselmis rufescens, Strain PCC563" /LENGTH=84 /DNA_ID=CAMNT_0014394995 /DNA_START=47 /DNA_END=301 /DNA_ORIENTATION=+
MLVNFLRSSPMLFSGSVSGITGMDTPGITNCTVNNSGFFVCNNSVEDMQYPSFGTGNGRDVVWEGDTDQGLNSCTTCRFLNWKM